MRRFVAFVAGLLMMSVTCLAVPTKLVVRVKANDAKFVGTGVGGLKVAVKDAFTGRILATGSVEGGTGNTKVLLREPITRGKVLSKGGAAKAEFVFDIDRPVKLEIEVLGPLGAGLNIHREVKTTWLIPGRDIAGDGILFNLYGLIVHPYSPKPHEFYKVGDRVKIGAHVTPMCGCPVGPKCLWDASTYRVSAVIYYKGRKIKEIPLKWASRISHFEGYFTPRKKGTYKIFIIASDNRNNQGVAITSAVVVPEKLYRRILGR